MNKLLKFGKVILGLVVSLSLFYFGTSRISMGISSVKDPYIADFMSVGLMYTQISLLILIALVIFAMYSLVKHGK